jgi:hypothetical protein
MIVEEAAFWNLAIILKYWVWKREQYDEDIYLLL